MLYDVFLSHATEDNELAERIARILREAGLKVFATVPGDPPGLWSEAVRLALEEAEWLWLLLTEPALRRSIYVHHEFGYFFGFHRRRIASPDIQLVGNRLRYIVRRGEMRRPGMYQHFQDFPVDDINDPEAIAKIILTETRREQERRGPSQVPVRQLMNRADYLGAIEEYTRQLEIDPTEHTKLLGRARAKYFYGDLQGMWEDVAEAERLKPGDRHVENFKKSVFEGTLSAGGSRPAHQYELERGNKHLERGEWQEALAVYRGILEYGISYQLNIAMAYLCGHDIQAADEALANWEQYDVSNPVVRIQGLVLRALIAALQNREETGVWEELQRALSRTPHFNLRRSPLKSLQAGMARTGVLKNPKVRRIFEAFPGNDVAILVGD